MDMRNVAKRYGREVHYHQAMLNVDAMPGVTMRQAIGHFQKDEQRAAMLWLDRSRKVPWQDGSCRPHPDDWLESRGEIVTDTAVGEAAYRGLHGTECGLISTHPSAWSFSPIEVTWQHRGENDDRSVELENWWESTALEQRLRSLLSPPKSWNDLQSISSQRFTKLTFTDACFVPLEGCPFAGSAAERILELLHLLDQLACAFDAEGKRTSAGHALYQEHFTGSNARFSDSSTTEKNSFRKELSFPVPGDSRNLLFCPWHGKERHLQLRIHFSWPIRSGEPTYVVYIGPKITKR